ncbi:DUF167 domain-containing protein [Novosphingobium sp.]|uniref:DUF167 domain-containing protein n=1 Tax=Novosphingobium sp. TaxID=1874826 RepID=UPI0022C71590|nr:DUF167 domain-containing protein [Novosphingobium sp.]MCZ8018917.1 DUF167 domain-containing protein [Novosphingobium sp.]MCZ8034523.1 DUF167 domain-containing protein [Novosphingobium sp.]MCZ8052071.1 DUF167 domain-containing protein [Novosphingobium sp.]MCZ8059997.1 DUF167 domain-containing protein [Novosphingobium sp.]MCZ8230959.1 DUF167 domain-containing protein [Novosphingobium sp.]
MARPRADLPSAGAIRALADAEGRLALRVTPGARGEAITIEQGRLLVKVRAKPEDGKANAAVLELLAEALGIATSRLRMLRGATGRDKLVRLLD